MGDEGISLSERSVARTEKPWPDMIRSDQATEEDIKFNPTYRVTMVVRDQVLLTLFLKLLNVSKLLCHFCPILTSPSRIGQTVEQMKKKSTKPCLYPLWPPCIWLWKSSDARWWDQATEINWMAGTYPLTLETVHSPRTFILLPCFVWIFFSSWVRSYKYDLQ